MRKRLYSIIKIMFLLVVVGCKNDNNRSKELEDKWVADGTQIKHIISIIDDKPVYAEKDLPPYILTLNEDGKYILQLKNITDTGTYEVDDEKNVYFDSNETGIWTCQLKKDKELHCLVHATLFIKE